MDIQPPHYLLPTLDFQEHRQPFLPLVDLHFLVSLLYLFYHPLISLIPYQITYRHLQTHLLLVLLLSWRPLPYHKRQFHHRNRYPDSSSFCFSWLI